MFLRYFVALEPGSVSQYASGSVRFLLRLTLVGWMAGLAGCRQAPADSTPSTAHPAGRPNVLLVTIDTLRADHLGAYGYATASTPTLDALAHRGVRFETAVAHVPLTGPSHASILTAQTPLGPGSRTNSGFILP